MLQWKIAIQKMFNFQNKINEIRIIEILTHEHQQSLFDFVVFKCKQKSNKYMLLEQIFPYSLYLGVL